MNNIQPYKWLYLLTGMLAFNITFAQQSTALIPADKGLTKQWINGLYAQSGKTPYKGAQLETIGMPIGGIAAGQLYIRGDGTLAEWWIANNAYNTGTGANPPLKTPLGLLPVNYATFTPVSFIDQGFRIKIQSGGKTFEKELSKKDFNNISFTGEYPIARVNYNDDKQKLPVDVDLEAFSPFIPLDAKESATPGTYLIFKIKNNAKTKARIDLSGWLQNPVGLELKDEITGSSRNQAVKGKEMQSLVMDLVPAKTAPFKEIVFADFESGNYNGWTATGEAFGKTPVQGQRSDQQKISGMSDKYYINSFMDGDKAVGQLVSKDFTINANYINLLVGGGNHPDETAVRLVIDGAVQQSATGKNSEKLEQVCWNVQNLIGKKAHFEIIDNSTGTWGHILADRITFSNLPVKRIISVPEHPYFGNVALSVLANKAVVFTDEESRATGPATARLGDKLTGALSTTFDLAPLEEKQVVFILTWYFPNRPLRYGGGFNWGKAIPTDGPSIGNMYANWYSSALDVAGWLQDNRKRLTMLTHRFNKSYYEDSNLPYWLKQRIMMPVSTLATETAQWWATDKFWAWEGVGSCPGTCTHVWNYEQALAHLFPDLERNIRERTDLSTSLKPDGSVLTRNGDGGIRIDGHIGTILKAYREHLNSENDLFLTRNWANLKKVARYAIAQDAADGSIDGVINNLQANTYDVDFYGANTFVGGLYLSALKAGANMALQMHDKVFADSCEAIFKSGSKLTADKLWNGQYFIQDVNLKQHPSSQYADGCLSDQLFGQTWAHLLNLGYIYPKNKVNKTLHSIWDHNWTKDVAAFNKVNLPERPFALSGDAGLFNCTWPLNAYPNNNAVPYRYEVWTGVEYQVATNMIYDGMTDEGLSIVKAVHDRYSPEKHNPWNEIECGDHYARALASWGILIALEDYYYDGPNGLLSFAPKIQQDNFNAFFTTAKGWGNLLQNRTGKRQVNELQLAYGNLHLSTVSFKIPAGTKPGNVSAAINGNPLAVKWKMDGEKIVISAFDEWLNEGDRLKITIL